MRDGALDAARGAAFVLMCVNHYGIATRQTALTRAAGHVARTTFMLLVGATFAVCPHTPRARVRRAALTATHAALVSAVSWLLLPSVWIRLGVLHCIALCSLALAAMDRAHLLGSVHSALAAGLLLAAYHAAPVTSTPLDLLTGAARTATLDWFPPLYWMSVVLAGHSIGAGLARRAPRRTRLRALAWLGRHSLPLYTAQMLALMLLLALRPASVS